MENKLSNKKPWNVKNYQTLTLIILLVGIIIFNIAFFSMRYNILFGALNQPLLDWMISQRSPLLTDFMISITTTLNPLNFLVLAGIITGVWAVYKRELWRPSLLVISIGITVVFSTIIKLLTANGRPPQFDMIAPLEQGYSFPSWHTIGMGVFLLVLGYLIYSRKPTKARIITWLLIAAIGTIIMASSRLYLGYHWLTDIIASVGLGLMIVAAIICIDRQAIKRFNKLK
ncbi:MAG: phosphatase PAP2 family protein [Candidatus Saccharimonadales bacterium]